VSNKIRRRAARAATSTAGALDDRLHLAGVLNKSLRKTFPDHWSFFLGEVALYSFIILILTGVFLTLFFQPSMSDVIYRGSYIPLHGVRMSEAYASVLHISFDVRGGLLLRQIHHWAALLFVAAIAAHLCRIFFTGAFRKPREINWLIGVTMFALAAAEGFLGYSLPDDALSGEGLRIADGVILSIPIVGTYLSYFLFGGSYPGHIIVERFYILHVLLIPGLLLALITAHLMLIWLQGHTQWPGKRERDNAEVGVPMYPVFMAKTGALFFFTFAAIAIAATVAQINPVWLWGPYNPVVGATGSQPDWYIGFMEGALRLMPNWSTVAVGHTLAWNVFAPAVLLPAGFFLIAGVYPFFEAWVTGDRWYHQVLDRPRNMPVRTALGTAIVAMGADLLLAGGDDVIALHLDVPLYTLVWILRIGFFVFPVLAFVTAWYACLALQRRDRRALACGVETGAVMELAEGSFAAVTQPLSDEQEAKLRTRRPDELVAAIPRHVLPLPTPRRLTVQLRTRLNRVYIVPRQETISSYGQPGQPDSEPVGPLVPDNPNVGGYTAGRSTDSD
jgi:ubiquinol-cytochrome c reductase cytochrome b subunit